jgi:hypothetical protein
LSPEHERSLFRLPRFVPHAEHPPSIIGRFKTSHSWALCKTSHDVIK